MHQKHIRFFIVAGEISQKSISFISLNLPYSDDFAVNELIATIMASLATFENRRRRELQREGIEAAKKAGKYKGKNCNYQKVN